MRSLALLALVSLLWEAPHLTRYQASSATISGRVVADGTGEGLPNVRITVTGVTSGAPVVLTDADGRFTILAPAGRGVVASKSGYARTELPSTTTGQPIEIRLRRGAAISGRVIDELGEPVIGARVTAALITGPPRRFTTVATTASDDRGEYPSPASPAALSSLR